MGVRNSHARQGTPNEASTTIDGKKYWLINATELLFKSGKIIYADRIDKSELYSLVKKLAKKVIKENLTQKSFIVFKKDGVWYQSIEIGGKPKDILLPVLEKQTFYKKENK